MNPELTQVDGTHYKNMNYQTGKFGFDVGAQSFGTQIAKYLTRDKGAKTVNLEKAYHCIQLDQSYCKDFDNVYSGVWNALEIYEEDDEQYLDKYFDQFADGKKLKDIFRQYLKGNFPQAKGLLRKYINSLVQPKPIVRTIGAKFQVGDTISKKIKRAFSNGSYTAKIVAISESKALDSPIQMYWLNTGGWLSITQLEGGYNIV